MLEMEGSDGDCGSCCLFARSGETGKRGRPGEAGNLKTGSMRLDLACFNLCLPYIEICRLGSKRVEVLSNVP